MFSQADLCTISITSRKLRIQSTEHCESRAMRTAIKRTVMASRMSSTHCA